jgi:hypothetical protein
LLFEIGASVFSLTRRENIPRISPYQNAEPGRPQRIETASWRHGFCIREKNGGHVVWLPFLVEKQSRGDLANLGE